MMKIINGNRVLNFNDDYPSIDVQHEFLQGKWKTSDPKMRRRRKYSSQWTRGDTEKRYDENIAKGRKHTYKKDDFYYDVNSNGFRCDNFDTMDFTKKSIIYLGCSKTYGIGVPESDAWPTMLHEMIQKEHNTTYNYINLGVPGGGIDYYLHFLPYFSKFNPKMVISATPEIVRMNLIKDDRSSEEVSNNKGLVYLQQCIVSDLWEDGWSKTFRNVIFDLKDPTPLNDVYKSIVSYGDAYFDYRKRVIFATIDSFMKMLDARFVEETEYKLSINKYHPDEANARDIQHPPKHSHKKFTEMMMDKIKGNNNDFFPHTLKRSVPDRHKDSIKGNNNE